MPNNIIPIASLQEFYFTGNIPDVIINSAEPIEVTIEFNSTYSSPDISFGITELHEPDSDDQIIISVSDILNHKLRATWGTNPFGAQNYIYQTNAVGEVVITPGETSPVAFQVVKGTVDTQTDEFTVFDFQEYIQKNLLTLCPQIRHVGYSEPNAVSFYVFGSGKVILKAHFRQTLDPEIPETYSETYDLLTVSTPNTLVTANINFSKIFTDAGWHTIGSGYEIQYIEIQGQDNSSSVKTHPIRLIPVNDYLDNPNKDWFAFENSLGGIDIISFTGVLSEITDHEYLSFVNRKTRLEHNAIWLTAFKKNTGYFQSEEEAIFAADFLASTQRYHYSNNQFKRIFIIEKEAIREHGEISAYTFNFAYANQTPGKLLNRKEEL